MNRSGLLSAPAPPDPSRWKSVRPGDAVPCPEPVKRALATSAPILIRPSRRVACPFLTPLEPGSRPPGAFRPSGTAIVPRISQENPPEAFPSIGKATGRS